MNRFKLILLCLCFAFLGGVKAQSFLTDSLLSNSFQDYTYDKYKARSVLNFKERSILYKMNPFSYVSIGLMFGYQRFISQQLGSECAFETTCSEHAKKAVERYGIFKGSLIGFYQLQSCTAQTGYDYPDHSINEKGEIINPVELNED